MMYGPEGSSFPQPPIKTEEVAALGDLSLQAYQPSIEPSFDNVVDLSTYEINKRTLRSESFYVDAADAIFSFKKPEDAKQYIEAGVIYNLRNADSAKRYLAEVHNRKLPVFKGEFDKRTLYPLVVAIKNEKRAAIYEEKDANGDYLHQNVAEHSLNVAVMATSVAAAERPDLDLGKISIMSNHHDLIVEAYGGDTPIHDIKKLATKEFREMASLTCFLNDVGIDNPIAKMMIEYEEGTSPEARFVNGIDKVEAPMQALDNRGALYKLPERNEEFEKVARGALTRASIDPTAFDLAHGITLELGRKWHEWKCRAFDGDYMAIVANIIADIESTSAEVLAFLRSTPEGMPIPENTTLAQIINLRPKRQETVEPSFVRPVLNEEELHRFGIRLLLPRSNHDDNPTPPSPSAPLAALSVEKIAA